VLHGDYLLVCRAGEGALFVLQEVFPEVSFVVFISREINTVDAGFRPGFGKKS
jgi:hypothetical protein